MIFSREEARALRTRSRFELFATFGRLLERKTIHPLAADNLHISAEIAEEFVDPAQRAILLRIA